MEYLDSRGCWAEECPERPGGSSGLLPAFHGTGVGAWVGGRFWPGLVVDFVLDCWVAFGFVGGLFQFHVSALEDLVCKTDGGLVWRTFLTGAWNGSLGFRASA